MNPPAMAGWNLALRFGLEIVALVAWGWAAWQVGGDPMRWIAVVLAPLLAAGAWGTFNVSGDPSRSGRAPVEVRGSVRLGVEALVLGGGAVGLVVVGQPVLAVVFAVLVVVHYAASWKRTRWLLGR